MLIVNYHCTLVPTFPMVHQRTYLGVLFMTVRFLRCIISCCASLEHQWIFKYEKKLFLRSHKTISLCEVSGFLAQLCNIGHLSTLQHKCSARVYRHSDTLTPVRCQGVRVSGCTAREITYSQTKLLNVKIPKFLNYYKELSKYSSMHMGWIWLDGYLA